MLVSSVFFNLFLLLATCILSISFKIHLQFLRVVYLPPSDIYSSGCKGLDPQKVGYHDHLTRSDWRPKKHCAVSSVYQIQLTCLASLSESPESSKGLLLPTEEGEDEDEEAEVKSLE